MKMVRSIKALEERINQHINADIASVEIAKSEDPRIAKYPHLNNYMIRVTVEGAKQLTHCLSRTDILKSQHEIISDVFMNIVSRSCEQAA